MWCDIYKSCIVSQRGLGIVYPRLVGNAKASICGIDDESFDPRFFICLHCEKKTILTNSNTEGPMVYNWRRTTMKKTTLMGIAALVVCGSVNATSWRVCSKPEAGANFTMVATAIQSNLVFSGDTLYIEPGHIETGSIQITKRLTIIGPGFNIVENNYNLMNADDATLQGIDIISDSVHLSGLKITGRIYCNNYSSNHTNYLSIDNCYITVSGRAMWLGGTGIQIKGCYIYGYINCGGEGREEYYTTTACTFENNIVYGQIRGTERMINWIVRNNTIVSSRDDENYVVSGLSQSTISNNIIINTSTGYRTQTNENQSIDTIFYKHYALEDKTSLNNDVHNNIISNNTNPNFFNSVFNASVEDVLIWNGANTLEEKYKHKTPGPAVGAGVNGTTCGAYGAVNGSRPYQPSGIPQYRPYIYDAQIDETPSSNNTINASFKIKVQQ